jgi:hypothetical protein
MMLVQIFHRDAMHFFHFSDTCYLGSDGSTKFLESIVAFEEGHSNAGSTLNCSNRWTHTNFSTFHAIQILIVIVKKLM